MGWLGSLILGYGLQFGTRRIPPLLGLIGILTWSGFAWILLRTDSIEPAAATQAGRLANAALLSLEAVLPLKLLTAEPKIAADAAYRGLPVWVLASAATLIGLALLGGLLVNWFGLLLAKLASGPQVAPVRPVHLPRNEVRYP